MCMNRAQEVKDGQKRTEGVATSPGEADDPPEVQRALLGIEAAEQGQHAPRQEQADDGRVRAQCAQKPALLVLASGSRRWPPSTRTNRRAGSTIDSLLACMWTRSRSDAKPGKRPEHVPDDISPDMDAHGGD